MKVRAVGLWTVPEFVSVYHLSVVVEALNCDGVEYVAPLSTHTDCRL
jgi:hypothetical protein